jgi:Tfp pilus assembly protein PilO
MARTTAFTKRVQIGKANRSTVVITSLAAFVLVFAIIAGRGMVNQIAYQQRVIDAKKEALATAQQDLQALDSLQAAYVEFVEADPNVLGGSLDGEGELDGDNAGIVLDALPSRYDFPALTSSLEELILSQNMNIVSIGGTDEEVAQSDQAGPSPQPIAIPFQVRASGSYKSVQDLVNVFARSIRPFQIQNLELSGGEDSMTVSIDASTFFQPDKVLSITEEVIE